MMNNSIKRTALFLIPPKVHLLDITGPAHIFYEAKDYGADIEARYSSIEGKEVESSAGIHFNKLEAFQDVILNKDDWIFIPGVEANTLFDKKFIKENTSFNRWLNDQHKKGVKICSVCTGAFILARSGLLDFKDATTHWKYIDRFKKEFPNVGLQENRLFVIQDSLYTSAGVSAGIDLALHLIEESYGSQFAVTIAKEVVIYLRRGESDPQLSVFLKYRNHLNNRIHEVQDYIAHHLNQKITVEELALIVNMSQRNLTRLFKRTAGITIGEYTEKLKIDRALHLIEDDHKFEYITQECGFKSDNHLRNLIKKYTGRLPSELR